MKKRIVFLLVSVMVFNFLGACSNKEDSKTTVVFADIGWDSILFHNAVAMFIAENAFGFETREVSGSTPITYTALLNGDIDVFMEMWTDNLEYYKDDLTQGKLKELGLNLEIIFRACMYPDMLLKVIRIVVLNRWRQI
jgi:ABC-type proline/glycine betaine transport system substrate-binding protein